LGLQVLPVSDGFFISKSKYVMDVLTDLNMVDNNPCFNPFQSGVKMNKNFKNPKVVATLY